MITLPRDTLSLADSAVGTRCRTVTDRDVPDVIRSAVFLQVTGYRIGDCGYRHPKRLRLYSIVTCIQPLRTACYTGVRGPDIGTMTRDFEHTVVDRALRPGASASRSGRAEARD
jgi:hypothetical protein